VSASQLLSTLIPVLLVTLAWLALFLIARPRYSWNYSPRTESKLLRPNEYSTPLSPSITGWFRQFLAIPDTFVLQHQSLDAYFFLRFLK
jgi:calcium permeable stress-gated cation channel